VIRDNDVVVYNFALWHLGGSRQANREGGKNYGPFKQKPPLMSKTPLALATSMTSK
jgi:hypothetical protein